MIENQQRPIEFDAIGTTVPSAPVAEVPPSLPPVERLQPMQATASGPDLGALRRTREIRLPDEYGLAGFKATVWVNCPSKLMDAAVGANTPDMPDNSDLERRARELTEAEAAGDDVSVELQEIDDETRRRRVEFRELADAAQKDRIDALCKIVTAHNGWRVGADVLPQPSDPAFWEQIPDELTAAIILLLRKEMNKLPSGVARAGSRR